MRYSSLLVALAVVACGPMTAPQSVHAPVPPAAPSFGSSIEAPRTGLLVMAHGGTPEWNETVMAAVQPSTDVLPTAVAFGMANPYALQTALDELEKQGVERVAVVRMFLSGESFLDQTEYFLGLSGQRPDQFVLMGPAAADPDARFPLQHSMQVGTHTHGILDSRYVSNIMVDRAGALSTDPSNEAVLLIAHGMGDDGENNRVLASMTRAAGQLGAEGYADVEIATLREDWEEKRLAAEAEIREYVRSQATQRDVLVIPLRLSGFGPYAEVLDGLEYSAGDGLLPHSDIGRWVLDTANDVTCASGWGPITGACTRAIADPNASPGQRD